MCPKRPNQRPIDLQHIVESLIEKSYSVSYKHGPNQGTNPAIGATTHGTRRTGPQLLKMRGRRASGPPNFVTSRVVINLNFTENSPNSWITYDVICGYSAVCILFMVSFFAAPFLA